MKLRVSSHNTGNRYCVINSSFLLDLISSLDQDALKLYFYFYSHSSDRTWTLKKSTILHKLNMSSDSFNSSLCSLRDHSLLSHDLSSDEYILYSK